MQKLILSLNALLLLSLLGCARANERSFDPSPYLGQAFRLLAEYEESAIQVLSGKYIYVEEVEPSELAVMHLFVSFIHTNENGPFFAMITIYLNPQTETYVDAFIDRLFLDELQADQSSAQGYVILYENMLVLAEALPNSEVYLDDLTPDLIERASR